MSCGGSHDSNANAAAISETVKTVNNVVEARTNDAGAVGPQPVTREQVLALVDEYAEAIKTEYTPKPGAVPYSGAKNVNVTVSRKYATLWTGGGEYPTAHSVVDLETGEVYAADGNGKPRLNYGPQYDLSDPQDRAVLFERSCHLPVYKRPWKEREEYRKTHPPKPKKERAPRDPNATPTAPLSPAATEYLRLLASKEGRGLYVSVPRSDSWIEGASLPAATARSLVSRGYAEHHTRVTYRGEEYLDKHQIYLTKKGEAYLASLDQPES